MKQILCNIFGHKWWRFPRTVCRRCGFYDESRARGEYEILGMNGGRLVKTQHDLDCIRRRVATEQEGEK